MKWVETWRVWEENIAESDQFVYFLSQEKPLLAQLSLTSALRNRVHRKHLGEAILGGHDGL